MRIISNFSDYYDNIQQYGIDENINFVRLNKQIFKFDKLNEWQVDNIENKLEDKNLSTRLNRSNIGGVDNDFDNLEVNLIELFSSIGRRNTLSHPYTKLETVHAVINGNIFTSHIILELNKKESEEYAYSRYHIVKKNANIQDMYNYLKTNYINLPDMHLLKKIKESKSIDDFKTILKNEKYSSYYSRMFNKNNTDKLNQDDLIEIHKKLESPIFYISNGKVFDNLPLTYFGFINVFNSVELLHQEIGYCLGNVIQNKNEPPQEITNLDKITQHGFDKKISFRKR